MKIKLTQYINTGEKFHDHLNKSRKKLLQKPEASRNINNVPSHNKGTI
jgi:hypothetical protein